MKKIISLLIAIALLFTSSSVVLAKSSKPDNADKKNHQKIAQQKGNKLKATKQTFKVNGSPVIKYGRYKLPLGPVAKGMGATVNYDRAKALLTVIKGTIKIEIDFDDKTVFVNGAADTTSGIFNPKNKNKMTVLIKYIAKVLGIRANVDDDEIVVEVPGLNAPANITLSTSGGAIKTNTLNSTTLYMTAAANISAGQAAGGKAELYVGSKLVATDPEIKPDDKTVQFTTSDGTPTNAELQALIPAGGVVTVRLYNANGVYVTSTSKNPTLTVDYVIPTLTSIDSAVYNAAGKYLYINVTGAGAVGDTVDVTRLLLSDGDLGKNYLLTNSSKGVINSANTLLINIGSSDKDNLAGFGGNDVKLYILPGSLITDTAGNVFTILSQTQVVNVTVTNNSDNYGLNPPTNVTITTSGSAVKANTLNNTTLYMTATANITAGQAYGGKAELYVGSTLVATDSSIGINDTVVEFTTSDGTPANEELRAKVPAGGVVTVRLYNAYGNYVTSVHGNPTLAVDYVAPTITGISSAFYLKSDKKLYIMVTGASDTGDIVDVTKLSLSDASLNISYTLTNSASTGSRGSVNGTNSLEINLGSADISALSAFEGSDVYLYVASGSLLTDAAGNTSVPFTAAQAVPVVLAQ